MTKYVSIQVTFSILQASPRVWGGAMGLSMNYGANSASEEEALAVVAHCGAGAVAAACGAPSPTARVTAALQSA